MANLSSTLSINLIDNVSKPARSVAQALHDAERAVKDVAKGMAGTGATDRFVKSLAGMKLAGRDIESVAKAWRDYSKSAGLAADSTKWTKTQAADVKAWEARTIASLRNVKREQLAYSKSIAAAAASGGPLPMTMAMSASNMRRLTSSAASAKMIAGMSASGGKGAPKALPSVTAAEVAASGGLLGGLSLGQVAAGYYGYSAGRKIVEGGVNRQSSRIAAMNAGMSPTELRTAEAAAIAATRYAPTMSASEIMELIQDIRSSVQEEKDIYRVLPQVARAASILKGMGVGNANVGDIVKAGDTLGLLTDPQRFEKFIGGQVKAMAVLGRTVTTEQVYEAAKYSKSAGATLSDNFLNLTMPGLIQELKGSSAGDTLSMLTKTLRGGLQSRHLPVMRLNEMGLLADPEQILRNKTGDIKGYAGKLVGDDMLASDPDKWFQSVFKPAAKKIGVEAMSDMVKLLSEVLPSRAANLARILMQQEQSLKTQARLFENAPDMKGMIANQKRDPKASFAELNAAAADLGAAALEAVPAAKGLSLLADALRTISFAASEPAKWAETVKAGWSRVGKETVASASDWWDRYTGAPGAFKDQPAPPSAPRQPAGPYMPADVPLPPRRPAEAIAAAPLPPRRPADLVAAPKVEKPASVVQRVAPASPVIKKPEPLPAPVSVISRPAPAPSPAPAPVAKPASPAPLPAQELKVTPSVGPLPTFAAQELKLTPILGDMPALPAQELKVLPTFAAIPPLPAQELSVIPKIDASGVSSFQSAVSGATSAFSTLNTTVTPNVNTSALDQVPPKAESARASLQGLNTTVSPHVDTGSISAAIGQVQHLLSLLNSVGGAANSAAAGANRAAAAARSAAASMAGLGRVQRGNFSYGGVQGE